MEEHNILIIANRREFRAWFEAHHANERECWVEVKRGRPVDDQHFWYLDAVEEAWHHKTQHKGGNRDIDNIVGGYQFKYGVPAIIIVQLALIVYFIITKINR